MGSASDLIRQWADALSDDELLLINNALNEILNGSNAIDEKEFLTRAGIERGHAREVLAEVNELFQKLQAVRSAN